MLLFSRFCNPLVFVNGIDSEDRNNEYDIPLICSLFKCIYTCV